MRVRPATADDGGFLAAMLREAAHWRPDPPAPPLEVILADPAVAHYVDGWPRSDDGGVVAVDDDDTPIGAAWWRRFAADEPAFGFVDDRTPEIAIGVVAAWRGQGVGTALLHALHDAARQAGLAGLSLSVARENPAKRLYERMGYVVVGGSDGNPTMVVELGSPS